MLSILNFLRIIVASAWFIWLIGYPTHKMKNDEDIFDDCIYPKGLFICCGLLLIIKILIEVLN